MPEKSDQGIQDSIRILVVQTAFLGDIILTTPLLLALKTAYPESHLALLTTPVGKSALQGLPELDEIISYDKNGQERGSPHFSAKAGRCGKRNSIWRSALTGHSGPLCCWLSAASRFWSDLRTHRCIGFIICG